MEGKRRIYEYASGEDRTGVQCAESQIRQHSAGWLLSNIGIVSLACLSINDMRRRTIMEYPITYVNAKFAELILKKGNGF